jgi:Fe-S cluster assembly iron-binding protein IscA
MLSITDHAAELIRALMESGAGGLRISTGPATSNGSGPALLLDVAPEPRAQDEVVDAGGAQVFVDPAVAPSLDGKVLDAHLEGEKLEFAVLDDEAG